MAKKECEICGREFYSVNGRGRCCAICKMKMRAEEKEAARENRVLFLQDSIKVLEARLAARREELQKLLAEG